MQAAVPQPGQLPSWKRVQHTGANHWPAQWARLEEAPRLAVAAGARLGKAWTWKADGATWMCRHQPRHRLRLHQRPHQRPRLPLGLRLSQSLNLRLYLSLSLSLSLSPILRQCRRQAQLGVANSGQTCAVPARAPAVVSHRACHLAPGHQTRLLRPRRLHHVKPGPRLCAAAWDQVVRKRRLCP